MVKPNFTGLWIFNQERSELQTPRPSSSRFEIEHDEPGFHMSVTHIYNGQPVTFVMDLTTDGKEYPHDFGELKALIRLNWDGTTLTADMKVERGDDSGTNVVRYSLQDNGQTLVAIEQWRTLKNSYDNVWIFDKEMEMR